MITHQLDARARKMLEDMQKLFRRWEHPVEQITTAAGQEEKTPFANGERWAKDHQWQDFEINLTTGATGLGGQQYLYLTTGYEGQWDAVNPQFLAEVNGHITQAFDVNHTRMPLHGNTQYAIVLHGYYARPANNLGCPYFKADLCEVNTELEQLYYDLKVPYEACLLLPPEDRERETTLEWISRALDLLDLRSPNSPAFEAGIAQARDFIRTAFYLPRQTLPAQATAQCVGHTHIDVAWLWDLYQSRHKAMRSFSTVLSLMDRYPEYRFMSSQPVLYEFVKQDAPELYARIRERVSEGRWEVEGGMWVEADCNETSGESLARQFMYGQKFFETEFGKRSRILWLPDVFGYSAALPQLMKQSGIDYFMTTKISWNEFNLMPYDTFQWKGMDGSKVLTHFAPAREFFDNVPGEGHEGLNYYTTYNALLQPSQIAGGWITNTWLPMATAMAAAAQRIGCWKTPGG